MNPIFSVCILSLSLWVTSESNANPIRGAHSNYSKTLKQSGTCDVSVSDGPDCFKPRTTPTFRIYMTEYGQYNTLPDLLRIANLFSKRFTESTGGALNLEFTGFEVIPLKNQPRDVSNLMSSIKGDDTKRDPDRLARLWYYYNIDAGQLITEIRDGIFASGHKPEVAKSDVIVTLSNPQFEGLGFASGGHGLVEQPSEIAWMASDGGSTDNMTDARAVDELLHEVGHLLGLDHAAKQCYENETDYQRMRACCDQSPSGTDVMSYCRARSAVNDQFYFKYTACTLNYLKTVTVPALIAGKPRPFQEVACP